MDSVRRWLTRVRFGYTALLLLSTLLLSLGLRHQGPEGSQTLKYAAMIFTQIAWLPPLAIAVCDATYVSMLALRPKSPSRHRLAWILGFDAGLLVLTWIAILLVLASY